MIFNYTLGIQNVEKNTNIINRVAIKAVIINKDNVFMVHTNKSDYKFPGGGTNSDETHEETLEREIREETGYSIKSVTKKIGVVTERKIDKFEKDSVFEMISHYYLCEISSKQIEQQLDDYEEELDLRPTWINIDRAIEENEQLLIDETKDKKNWVYRETLVLRSLRENIGQL